MKPRHSYFCSALQSVAVFALSASAVQAVDYNFGTTTENFTLTASSQARVQGVSTGTGAFSDSGFGGVYDRGTAQDALYLRFNLEPLALAGAIIHGDVNLNFTVNATWGGAINNGIIGTANGVWSFPGSAPGLTPFTPVSAPNGTFTTGQTATWTIANSTFTGILGNLGSFNGLAVTAGDNSQAHFSNAGTLTGNYTTSQIRVIDGTDWSAASWDDPTKTLSIGGSSDVTDGTVVMLAGTTLSVSGSATLNGGVFSGRIVNNGTITYGSSSAQTLSGAISGAGSLTQAGSGALTLSGSNSYSGATTVSAGKLILSGNSTGDGVITVADTASGKASLEVSGTMIGSNALNIGSGNDSVGALQLTSGSLTRNFLALGVTPGSYGAANISGGSLNVTGDMNIASWGSGYQSGGGRGGLVEISGGTVTVAGWVTMNRWGGNQDAVLNVSGGSLTYAGGGLVANWNADGADTSVITVSGTGSIATTNNSAINLSNSGAAANTGILNLNGGTVTPSRVIGGRGFVNFNGGTLRANSDQGDFLAVNTARIYSGGATIDTNGRNITIGQPLLAPVNDGVATIPVTDGGSGYVSAPILKITGGTGSGATAVANMIPDGNGALKIGSVTVTSPGSYTDATGIAVSQVGGGATTPATLGTMNLTANDSGSLTKIGIGTLTLTGANTFTGGIHINQGMLLINNDNNLGAANGAVALNGGTLKGAAAITLGSGRTVTLGASGGYFSNGSNQSWIINSKLTGTGFIGFNYDSSSAQSMTLTSTSNDYSGETRIGTNGLGYFNNNVAAANLRLGAVNALPYGTGKGNVIVGYDVNGTAKASLDLNGFDTQINGLATNNAANASVNNSSSTATTLTLGHGDASATFGGVIQNTGSGALSLVKTGSGTQTLTATNSYLGNTTVIAGTLSLGNGNENTSLADSADVIVASGAVLNLNFSGTDTVDELWLDGVRQSPGTYHAENSSGFITGTGSLTVQNGPSASDYDTWKTDNAVTGAPTDDDDSDGLSNFEEYAFGLDPTGGSSVNPIVAQLNKSTGLFRYSRRLQSKTGLTYTVRSSTTLATNEWTNLVKDTHYTESVTTDGDIETVTITLTPAPTSDKLFIQVKAESP